MRDKVSSRRAGRVSTPPTDLVSVRRLGPPDAEAWLALRVAALAGHPEAFAASLDDTVRQPLEDVRARLPETGPDAVFGAVTEGRLVGIAGFSVRKGAKLAHKGVMWGVYVAPEARRLGAGSSLVEAVVGHARRHVSAVLASVSAGNRGAARLYRRHGFRAYGTERSALVVDGRAYDERLLERDLSSTRLGSGKLTH